MVAQPKLQYYRYTKKPSIFKVHIVLSTKKSMIHSGVRYLFILPFTSLVFFRNS